MTRTSPSYSGYSPASPAASKAMRGNRKRGTLPERRLASALWRRGLRYWKHAGQVIGNPDFVFSGVKVAVFCDGDFWHGRDWPSLHEKLLRRANSAYWVAKISSNIARDLRNRDALEAAGWVVIRVWERDVSADVNAVAATIEKAVKSRRAE